MDITKSWAFLLNNTLPWFVSVHNTQAKARFEVVESEDVSLEDHDVIAKERGFEADRNLRPVEAHAAWRTLRGLKMIWNQKGKNDSGF